MAGGETDLPLDIDSVPTAEEPVIAGRYRVIRLIARGGMAAVYLAEHIQLRRQVALKILYPQRESDDADNFEARFRIEAETLATLDHPNIVTLYDYGQADDGRFFLAMEYIDGPRFTDVIANGRLEPDRAIELILQVCAGLRYAHRRGVVHRDLKPSNLLLRYDSEGMERLKVVDFGLAKVAELDQSLTREGLVLGSPHCMAPEQVKGLTVDHRADIYAIGVLLFRALTGAYPFHAATGTGTMVAHLQEPVPAFNTIAADLHVPPRLEALVRKCLSKRPEERVADVRTLMEELAACVGIEVEPDSQTHSQATLAAVPVPLVPPSGASRLGVGIAAVLVAAALVVFVGVLAGGLWWLNRAPPEAVVISPPVLAPPVVVTPPPVAPPAVTPPLETPPAVAPPAVPPPLTAPPEGTPVTKPTIRKPPVAAPPDEAPPEKPTTPEGYMPLPDDFQ